MTKLPMYWMNSPQKVNHNQSNNWFTITINFFRQVCTKNFLLPLNSKKAQHIQSKLFQTGFKWDRKKFMVKLGISKHSTIKHEKLYNHCIFNSQAMLQTMSMFITTYLYFFNDLFSEWAHFCWATDSHLLATFVSEK